MQGSSHVSCSSAQPEAGSLEGSMAPGVGDPGWAWSGVKVCDRVKLRDEFVIRMLFSIFKLVEGRSQSHGH